MLVELELIVTLCTKMVLVSNPTLLELTATMQLTAISKGRAKLKGLVTLQELPLLLHQIPVNPLSHCFLPLSFIKKNGHDKRGIS